MVVQDIFGIMRFNGLIDRFKNTFCIFFFTKNLLRNHLSCHLRNFLLIGFINLHPGIFKSGEFSFKDGGTGTQPGDDWQQDPYCGMQFFKFRVTVKWQVNMHALHIAPAMAATVKNAVIKRIYLTVIMFPELHFGFRMHQGV